MAYSIIFGSVGTRHSHCAFIGPSIRPQKVTFAYRWAMVDPSRLSSIYPTISRRHWRYSVYAVAFVLNSSPRHFIEKFRY